MPLAFFRLLTSPLTAGKKATTHQEDDTTIAGMMETLIERGMEGMG